MSVIKDHSALREQVLKTLLYFDIFSYPLKAGEVFRFLQTNGTNADEVAECLDALVRRNQVFRYCDLYSLHANEKNIQRRLNGNNEAEKWLKVAVRKARFIARFPFVRGVMASGSLSKGYMDEKSDLDFFVVTAAGRLWIARTLLVMYKRLFLFNSHKHFCVNYFVDVNHLEIEEKNLFTATELVTLIPLFNYRSYEELLRSNEWARNFLPNFTARRGVDAALSTPSPLRNLVELMLRPFAHSLDAFFMRLSGRRWRRLYADKFSKEDFEIAFKTRKHVSKNHPNYYQKKILNVYESRLIEFQHRLRELTTYE